MSPIKSQIVASVPKLKRAIRSARWLLLFFVPYWVLLLILSLASNGQGLLSPSGSIDFGYGLLAGGALFLRVIALFIGPVVVAYWLVLRLLKRPAT